MRPDELKLLTLSCRLALELRRMTALLPPEEDLLLVPVLRNEVLELIENVALGSAEYHPIDRFRFLVRARTHLETLRSKVVFCRTTGLVTRHETSNVETLIRETRTGIDHYLEALKAAIRNADNAGPW